MTRPEVARVLGLSVWTIRALERRGDLSARLAFGTCGPWIYEPRDVFRLATRMRIGAPRDPGRISARAFELFEKGADLRECVKQLCEPPDVVRLLYAEWKSDLDEPSPLDERRRLDGGPLDEEPAPLSAEEVAGAFQGRSPYAPARRKRSKRA